MKISFSKKVFVPYFNLEEMKQHIFLDLELSTPIGYTWWVAEMKETHITLKLKFDNPNMIGLSKVEDRVRVTVNPYLFRAQKPEVEGLPEYLFNTQYSARIRLIVDPDDFGVQLISNLAAGLKIALGAGMIGALLMQGVFSQALSSLWGVINSLQILTFFPLLWVETTPYLFIFFSMLHVSHFDVIPFGDWLYKVA